MILIGLILALVGFFGAIHILLVIGVILLVIGLVLAVAGGAGHPVGGRGHWW
jgi:Family of unknown function (DUF6131)